MIAYLCGKVIEKQAETVILDVQGVGYEVWCPPQVVDTIVENTEQKLYTVHIVREDSQTLYGFLTQGEKELFQLLLSVSGIGPKNALKVVSKVSGNDISRAIVQQDSGVLEIMGIGKKMAERIIVELKGKPIAGMAGAQGDGQILGDEVAALVALGYNARDVIETLKGIEAGDVHERVKAALRVLGR